MPVPAVALCVGCSSEVVGRCRAAAEAVCAVARECDLESLADAVARMRPFAIVAPLALVERDRYRFAELSKAVGALLVQLSSERVSGTAIENALRRALGRSKSSR